MKRIIATALLALAACTEGPPPQSAAAAAMKTPPPPSACPFGVQGASIAYEEIPAGARLTLTAPPDKLEDLRQRTRDAAAMWGPGQRLGAGHDGKHGDGGHHGLKAMQMPPADGRARDVEQGARIDLTPQDPNDLAVLRTKVQARARELMASCD